MKLLTFFAAAAALGLSFPLPTLAQKEVTFPTLNEDGATV